MEPQRRVTFAPLLAERLRRDPGRPLVTFYDQASGERVELSTTTYANWVAKTSSLLVDELGLERGDVIVVDLGPHWLATVLLGAAWECGLVVARPGGDDDSDDADDDPAAVVCGPDTLGRWAPRARDVVVIACALLPLGVRFPDGVPPGVHDLGVEVWSQPDAFVAFDPPTPDDAALLREGGEESHGDLWARASTGALDGFGAGGRLLSTADPVAEPLTFAEPLARGGSLVLVARAEPDALAATFVAEHATARFPA